MRRILFLGQKPVAEEAWESLMRGDGDGYRVVAACSNRRADAVWWRSNRIYESRGAVAFVDNAERNEAQLLAAVREHGVDTIVCMQHSWILSGEVLAAVRYNALNFHNAKLPAYRGYNAVNHALLNRDEQFTCTLHWMTEEVDRGEIALEAVFDITPADTALSLYAKSHVASLRLFDRLLSHLRGPGPVPRRPMEAGGRFYPRKSIEPLREIADPAGDEADLKARAFFFPPFEPAYLRRGDGKLYVLPQGLTGVGFATEPLKTLRAVIEEIGKDFNCEIR